MDIHYRRVCNRYAGDHRQEKSDIPSCFVCYCRTKLIPDETALCLIHSNCRILKSEMKPGCVNYQLCSSEHIPKIGHPTLLHSYTHDVAVP